MKNLTALKFALLAALALAAPAQAEENIVFSTDSRSEAVSAPALDKQAAPAGQDRAEAAAGKQDKSAGTAVNAAKAGVPAAGALPAAEKAAPQNTAETAAAALKDASRPAAKAAYFEPRSLINY